MSQLPTYQEIKLLTSLGILEDSTDLVNKLNHEGKLSHLELLDWTAIICDKYKIKNWSINKEGQVDVDGDVNLEDLGLTQLPLRFGKVTGRFLCNGNQLTTLEGAPKEVSGSFWCWIIS